MSLIPLVHQVGEVGIARRSDQTYRQYVSDNYGITIALGNIFVCRFCGLGVGVVINYCDYFFGGFGAALLHIAKGECVGLFIGVLGNYIGELRGVMSGLWNYAGMFCGVQLGLVNICGPESGGVQVGLLNFRTGHWVPLPLLAIRK